MFWAATLLLTCFHIDALAAQAPGSSIAPAYRIDLRPVVKAEAVSQLGTRETPWVPVITLHFLDSQRLAATFVTQSRANPGLATRGSPDAASPFRLRGVVLEASTGAVRATPEWPIDVRAAGIVAANDRGVVTEIDNQLTLLSPELRPMKEAALPSCGGGSWYPTASWSGDHVLLGSGPAWSEGCWLWIDSQDLRIVASWRDLRAGPVAVSDDRLVWEPARRDFGDPPSPLKIATPGGNWRPIPSTEGASTPEFVGPDLIYFQVPQTINHPTPAEAFLIRTDGSQVFRLGTTRQGWAPGGAAVSRAGNRFVILQGQMKGSYPALDIGGHSVVKGLLVYDPPFRTPSYALKVRDSKVRNSSAALSPDGRHLAVLGYPEPVLEVFELPPVN